MAQVDLSGVTVVAVGSFNPSRGSLGVCFRHGAEVRTDRGGADLIAIVAIATTLETLFGQRVMAVVAGLLTLFAAWLVWRAARTLSGSR